MKPLDIGIERTMIKLTWALTWIAGADDALRNVLGLLDGGCEARADGFLSTPFYTGLIPA